MKLTYLFTMLPVLILVSCSKKECDDALTRNEFKVGVEYCLSDNKSITIDSIADSRCPTNVICVWEGETKLYMNLVDDDILYPFEITVPNNDEPFVVLDKHGYNFIVEEINPYPLNPEEIDQDSYVVKMSIDKTK